METTNKVNNGLHLDFNEYDQPQDTMRDNRNGIITDLDDGAFMWTNLEGTKAVTFTLDPNDAVMGTCFIRDRLFMIIYNNSLDYVIIYRANVSKTGDISGFEKMWEGYNSIAQGGLNLSLEHPIRSMYGYYESENVQRIYWTDFYNPPRVINVGSEDRLSINEKFINFFPEMDPVYGKLAFSTLYGGGNCKAGTYYVTWRLFAEGYYTDWSYLSPGIQVSKLTTLGGYASYHEDGGEDPDENLNKRIRLNFSELDTDYQSIEVAVFYSNALNSAAPGFVVYNGDITSSTLTVYVNGNENLGTVSIDDIIEVSSVIKKCKDMTHISKMNVMANIEERAEIDLTGVAPINRNDQIEVNMQPIKHAVHLDSTGMPLDTYTDDAGKVLFGVKNAVAEVFDLNLLLPEVWYQAGPSGCSFTDDDGARSIPANEVFQINPISATEHILPTSGSAIAVGVKRKYKPASATEDINDSVLEIVPFTSYHNYKNPEFTYHFRGYPGGETVRLGVTFYDKTGRPFYTRHLFNVEETFAGETIGPGDFKTIERKSDSGDWSLYFPCTEKSDQSGGIYYKNIIGRALGIEINGLDISSIKDDIGGFSIVRAPMERTKLAYGYLLPAIADGGDVDQVSASPGLRIDEPNGELRQPGTYLFYSPEDIYQLDDFVISPGDNIVNAYYLNKYETTFIAYENYTYLGRRETDYDSGDNYQAGFYAKYARRGVTPPSNDNAALGASHEVKFATRYTIGDDVGDGVNFDPSTPGALFRQKTQDVIVHNVASYCGNTNILVLDIDESSDDYKGDELTIHSHMLVCYVERENNNPYGGTGEASLANTSYVSTGHYQEITDAILADIYDGTRWVFNGIQIYGGDAFVGMFSNGRLLKNHDDTDNQFSSTIIMPIESRINIDMRRGDSVAKDRTYDATNNPAGIRWLSNNFKLEVFNYNNGYSTDNLSDLHTSFPFNTRLEEVFDTRIRYSEVKSYGEREDSFREFPSLNRLDLGSEYGSVNNIRSKNNRLVYWQRDTVGYIPINERALTPNSFGQPVQLGVGGVFERYDDLIKELGNSNQFGLVESPAGFHWYDAVRKVFVTLKNNMQFDRDSLAKGMDRWFVNEVFNNMDLRDNPVDYEGVIGGYDPRHKIVLITFRIQGETPQTVGLDMKSNKFVGFFDFGSRMYFNYKSWLYSVDDSNYTIYQHGEGVHGNYHGQAYPQYFSIIIKGPDTKAKIFDNFEYIGSEETFSKIIYEGIGQTIEESASGNRNLKYRNRRYYGNFPKVSRERLTNGWIKVTFYYNGSNPVSFNEIVTQYRKML